MPGGYAARFIKLVLSKAAPGVTPAPVSEPSVSRYGHRRLVLESSESTLTAVLDLEIEQ